MWKKGWRDEVWAHLEQPWDLLVIGGGITGAGILREASRLGLKALLVEQHDFAWGTSSRSSKLVHGGLRYLGEGKVRLTRASVHEREQLLSEGPGLIDPLGFLQSVRYGDSPGRLTFEMGLTVYDLLALQWDHHYYSADDFQMLAPHISRSGLQGGFRFGDAQTDDARLVLRVIQEAVRDGGVALHYTKAEELVLEKDADAGPDRVVGARLKDCLAEREAEVRARVVVNATGVWADRLRGQVHAQPRIRPLRGSHLIFPAWRLPVAQAVSFLHPIDHRPVMIFPWEGITLVGTTDIDCDAPMDQEPAISPVEVAYLMAAVEFQFPSLNIGLEDIVSTYAGVRPVIGSGKANPSDESREHVIWEEDGLLTVTGGKLTTFRLIAQDVLKAIVHRLPQEIVPKSWADIAELPVLDPLSVGLWDKEGIKEKIASAARLDEPVLLRLSGRYGADAPSLVAAAMPEELDFIPGTKFLWAELHWVARAEGVIHLDDLLFRRVRLGLLLPGGAAALLPRIRPICQPELGWEDDRWEAEEKAYLELWRRCYSLPERARIPDWRQMLAENQAKRLRRQPVRRKITRRSMVAGTLAAAALGFSFILWRRRSRDKGVDLGLTFQRRG